jgi:hypothetical protein
MINILIIIAIMLFIAILVIYIISVIYRTDFLSGIIDLVDDDFDVFND